MLVGELLEVGAAVELLDDRLGLFLGLDQDVARLDLVDRRRVCHLLVVAGAHLLVGDLGADVLVDQFAVQRALLEEGHAALEVRVLVEPFRDRLVGQQPDLHDRHEGRGAALLRRQLRVLLVDARPARARDRPR